MSDYLERSWLISEVENSLKNNPHENPMRGRAHNIEHRRFLDLLSKAPAANVAPAVNAAWIWYEDIPTNSEFEDMAEWGWKCSACKQSPDNEDNYTYYDDYDRE